jgi:predicted permease
MTRILLIIAPLFLIIFATAVLQRWRNLGESWTSALNEYALKIGLPVLIFSSLSKTHFSFVEQAPLIAANSIFLVGSFLAALAAAKIFRRNVQMTRTLVVCFTFENVTYLGIPILAQLYGEPILPAASLIVAVHTFWVFTLTTGYLDVMQKESGENIVLNILKNLVKNPLLGSVFFGLLAGSLNIPLPGVVWKSLDMVSASVTPTVLIVIGLFIGKSRVGKLRDWMPVIIFSLFTLFALPAGFYFGLKICGIEPSAFTPSLLQAAMPLAITPFALANHYRLQKEFIARSIVLSTVLAALSLPFWVSLLS